MFLDYGGDKEFGVKGYVDASFNTYLNDSEQQTGYVQWSNHLEQLQVERGSSIYNMTQKSAEVHTDLNVTDPLTKTSLTSRT